MAFFQENLGKPGPER